MNMLRNWLWRLGLAVLLGFQACTLAAADAPVLLVGITPEFPPMAFKQDKQLAGLEVDFARALGGELGREVKFVELETWASTRWAFPSNQPASSA